MADPVKTRPPPSGQPVAPAAAAPKLLAGVLFGLAFGFLLQKGGVGKFNVLIGQLLLQDFTVAKVMLTAIVVGMVGVFTLHHFGKVNLHLKPTRIGSNVIGVASTIILYLWRTGHPHMAVVGRVPNTQHFRNVKRHDVQTLPHVLMLRIDESLYFANAKYIEDCVLAAVAARTQLRHLVLICNAVNFIDASALETLTDLHHRLQDAGVELYLTEVKGPVMDQLADTEFLEQLGSARVYLSTEAVYEKLAHASRHTARNS